jgi:hypothetical protein
MALLSAVAALFPRTEKNLNYNDLIQVSKAYNSAIDHRVLWARISTGALAAALILGLTVFLLPRGANPTQTLSATWDGSGTKLLLDASASTAALPDDAHVTMAVVNQDSPSADLGTTKATPGKNGTAKSEVKIPLPSGVKLVRITSTIGWGKLDGRTGRYEHHHVDDVSLTVPPFTAPTLASK